MRKLTDEQVVKIRHLVWDEGYTYRAAAEAVGITEICWTSLTAVVRGLAYKTLGGPTGGAAGRKPRRPREAVQES